MTDIRDLADLMAPKGWSIETMVGWPDDPEGPQKTVTTAAGELPFHSHTNVRSTRSGQTVTLLWEIPDGSDQLRLQQIRTSGEDDHEDLWLTLMEMTKARRFDGWRRSAVSLLLMSAAAQQFLDEGRGPESMTEYGIDAWTDDDLERIGHRMAYAEQLAAPPRRERISNELLRDVARVYREAHAEGRRPTQAVASHFDKPRSTAGRWVGLARQAGFLGKADGPRAGERSDE